MQKDLSLNEVVEIFKSKGYTYSFYKKNNYIYCNSPALNFHTHELNIQEVYSAVDKGNISSRSVVYTIESARLGIKGLLINEY
ncbi:MAG: hypothetical protein ABJB11_05080 [Ferruginibacter sp.]